MEFRSLSLYVGVASALAGPAEAGTCHSALAEAVRHTVAMWKFVPAYERPAIIGAEGSGDASAISGPANDLSQTPVVGEVACSFVFSAGAGRMTSVGRCFD
jgi:hypothetical protein